MAGTGAQERLWIHTTDIGVQALQEQDHCGIQDLSSLLRGASLASSIVQTEDVLVLDFSGRKN